ncbi:MAG: tRNA 4-thiouridine(8) synthase ThiI [Candidatus Paceibacterota bacterium]|jgi:tRNA U34 2-thiouridine synthase MnmA/TrmU
MNKTKALLLMSGGLDSLLAAKILQNQGIQIKPVCFKSYFFDCETAQKTCKQLGLKLQEVDFSKKYLTMLKSPKFGRGTAFNPCIDCHLLMLKEAKKIMIKDGYDFIATGEVVGERPMSQNLHAIQLIEKEAKLDGMIVRPLSLKVLPITIPEKKGLINRDDFYGISGRSRKPQLQMIKDFGIKEFVTPGGGCILTEKYYGINLKKLLSLKKNPDDNDCNFIRAGRVFWENSNLIVVARNEKESKQLKKIRKSTDLYLEPKNFPGPSIVVRPYKKSSREGMIFVGKKYLMQFSKNIPNDPVIEISPV